MKKKRNWIQRLFIQLLKNIQISEGYDPDFGEKVKIGFKDKAKF